LFFRLSFRSAAEALPALLRSLRSLHQHRPRRLSLGFCVEVFLPLIDFANGFSRRRSQARRSSLCLSRTARRRCLLSRTALPRRRAVRGRISESPWRRRCLLYLGSVTRFHTPLVLESGSSQTLPVFSIAFSRFVSGSSCLGSRHGTGSIASPLVPRRWVEARLAQRATRQRPVPPRFSS
jgi:hypothetical protein